MPQELPACTDSVILLASFWECRAISTHVEQVLDRALYGIDPVGTEPTPTQPRPNPVPNPNQHRLRLQLSYTAFTLHLSVGFTELTLHIEVYYTAFTLHPKLCFTKLTVHIEVYVLKTLYICKRYH
jgi:hypothetical protein